MADDNSAAAAPSGGTEGTAPAADVGNLIDAAKAPSAAPAAVPAAAADWFWADGVKGADKAPEWFDGKKYKSVADQAKAYPDLFKKFGEQSAKLKGFTGAPEKYELTIPEAMAGQLEWKSEDPLLGQFQTIAKESGMSQETFNRLLHTFAQYEYENSSIDWEKEKAAIGERSDERLTGFWDWVGANMDEETSMSVKHALGTNPTPSQVFKALEAVQSATRQPAVNRVDDTVQHTPTTVEALDRKYRTPDPTTKRALIDTPDGLKAYRAELSKVVGSGEHREVVGQRRAS